MTWACTDGKVGSMHNIHMQASEMIENDHGSGVSLLAVARTSFNSPVGKRTYVTARES